MDSFAVVRDAEADPAFLLLEGNVPLPDASVYVSCTQTLAGDGLLDGFGAVYLALPNETGEMLHETADCFPPRQQP